MSCAPTGEDDAASAMWLTPDEVTALREAWDRYGRALTTDTELVQFFFELGIDIASSQLAAPTPSNAADHPSSSSPGTAANDHRGGLSRWVPCESFDDVKALARHLKWEHQANTESDGELAFAAVQTAAAAQRGSTSGEASIARAAIQSLLRPFGIALDSAFAPPANIAASQRRRSSVAPPSRRPSDVSATNVAMAKSLEEDLGPPLAVQDFARLFGQPTHAETSLKGQLLGFRFASSTMAKGKATTLSGSTSLRTTVVTDGMAASVSPHRKSTFARKATMRLPAADRKESTAIPSPSVHGTVAGELGGRLGGTPTSMARSFLSVSMATHEQSVNALAGQSVLGRVKLLSEAPPPTTQIGGVPEGSGGRRRSGDRGSAAESGGNRRPSSSHSIGDDGDGSCSRREQVRARGVRAAAFSSRLSEAGRRFRVRAGARAHRGAQAVRRGPRGSGGASGAEHRLLRRQAAVSSSPRSGSAAP